MNEVSVFEALEIAWRRKLLIVALVLVATAAAYGISANQPKIYQAETTLVFPGGRPNVPIPGLEGLAQRLPTLTGAMDSVPSSTAVVLPLLRSRTLGERVVRSCRLTQEYKTGSIQGATNLLRENTMIAQDPSGAIVVTVKAKKPQLAARIANSCVTELKRLADEKIDLSMNRRSGAIIDDLFARVKRRLAAAEERLNRFQKQHHIVALPAEAQAAVQQVATLEQDRETTQLALQQTNAQIAERRRQIEAQTSQPLEELPADSPIIQNGRAKLIDLNSKLALAKQEFTNEDPSIQSLNAQIAEAQRQLQAELTRVRGSLRSGLLPALTQNEVDRIAEEARLAAISRVLDRAQRNFDQLPDEQLELSWLERDRSVQDALYSYFTSEREKLRVLEAREGPAFVVLDPAVVPEGPIAPRPRMIAILAAVLSLVVATTLAFVAEYAERARYARGKRAYLAVEHPTRSKDGSSRGPLPEQQEELQPPAHVSQRG